MCASMCPCECVEGHATWLEGRVPWSRLSRQLLRSQSAGSEWSEAPSASPSPPQHSSSSVCPMPPPCPPGPPLSLPCLPGFSRPPTWTPALLQAGKRSPGPCPRPTPRAAEVGQVEGRTAEGAVSQGDRGRLQIAGPWWPSESRLGHEDGGGGRDRLGCRWRGQ